MNLRTDSFWRFRPTLSWRFKTGLLTVALGLAIAVIVLTQSGSLLNQYQSDGELVLDVLDAPVQVKRDMQGVPYVIAQNKRDMIRAQGFVVAQDRLFQLEMYRAQIWGGLSAYLGSKTVMLDKTMRIMGFGRLAAAHVPLLSPSARQYLQDYLDGLNAYITLRRETHPIELQLVGIEPTPWTLTDAMAVLYFINYETGANRESEIIAQALIERLGVKRASDLFPLNINPMRQQPHWPVSVSDSDQGETGRPETALLRAPLNVDHSDNGAAALPKPDPLVPTLSFGSNAWAVAPDKSASGHAVLANDPHVDARILPGIWYPMGLSFPGFRAVGGALPAIPGLLIGRNDKVAFSMTNGYGDTQDLYIERPDPDNPANYLEGSRSIPFDQKTEIIRVKDEDDIVLTIRFTRRGPVISDHGLTPQSSQVISLRWSVAESFSPDLGFDRLLFAQSAQEADQAIQSIRLLTSNIAFADRDGNIGFRASGLIPIRANRDGSRPQPVEDSADHWNGWIPGNKMPGEFNPSRGWVATANHDVRPDDYPFYYSSYFSAAYRFQRIAGLLDGADNIELADHSKYQSDTLNLQARRIVPILLPMLRQSGHTDLAQVLQDWNYHDDADLRAPLLYQALYHQIAASMLQDELGDELTSLLLETRYFWVERFDAMLAQGNSVWFDDVTTSNQTETLTELVDRAATIIKSDLADRYGGGANWGDAHRVTFVSPLRLSGTGAAALGGGDHAISGSNETLLRSTFRYSEAFKTRVIDSARLVIDMADDTGVAGIVSGGQTARQFHRFQQSQLSAWRDLRLNTWWLGEPAAATETLILKPH